MSENNKAYIKSSGSDYPVYQDKDSFDKFNDFDFNFNPVAPEKSVQADAVLPDVVNAIQPDFSENTTENHESQTTPEARVYSGRSSRRFWLITTAAAAAILVFIGRAVLHDDKPKNEKKKPKTENVAADKTSVSDSTAVFRNEAERITAGMTFWDLYPSASAIADFNRELIESSKEVAEVNTATYEFNTNFSSPKFNPLFDNLSIRESGFRKDANGNYLYDDKGNYLPGDYTESPYESSHAFGKYQGMPETMVHYGYLARSDENPDLKSIKKWKDQSFDSEYMTIVYKGNVNHYKWTAQDGMNSLNDWCNTEKGHELQEKFGKSHYADNVAAIRNNGKNLYNTLHLAVDVPVYKTELKKGKKVRVIDRYINEVVLVDEPGLAYAAHLMGAVGIMTIVRNEFKPSKELSGDVNNNIANSIEYLKRGIDVDGKEIRKTGKTYDMLLKGHPDYQAMKEKLDLILAQRASGGLNTADLARQAVENSADVTKIQEVVSDSIKNLLSDTKKFKL